jgi:hypothetical protein
MFQQEDQYEEDLGIYNWAHSGLRFLWLFEDLLHLVEELLDKRR